MMVTLRFTRLVAILPIFLAVLSPLCAQVILHNPSLPAEEDLVYAVKAGEDSWTVRQSMILRSAKGDTWYEFRSSSPESDMTMLLDAVTLFPRSSEVTTHSADSVIRRTTEIIKATPHPKANELVIGDFASLPVTLRGLPWGTFASVNLITLGATGRGQQFSLQLSVVGRESISAGGKLYDCWKAQLGLGGVFGSLIGKSSYWFSADVPHFLVRSETPSGGPGSPLQKWELQSYSARNP